VTAPEDDLDALIEHLGLAGAGTHRDGKPVPEPAFDDVGAFVEDYLRVVIERRVAGGPEPGVRWCARWWAHPEALSRIYAIWRAWETLRVTDPATGMSTWWRDHLDPHLTALTNEYGPFSRCTPDRHSIPAPLPTIPVPPEVVAQLPDTDG
jgi:Domain of unknown function (DUF4913)